MRSAEVFSRSFTNPPPAGCATIGTFCYALPDVPMALHASAAWVAAAAFCCGAGAVYGLLSSATMLTLRSVRQVTWADSQPDDP